MDVQKGGVHRKVEKSYNTIFGVTTLLRVKVDGKDEYRQWIGEFSAGATSKYKQKQHQRIFHMES